MIKQTFFRLVFALAAATMMLNCNDAGTSNPPAFSLNSTGLFPFQNNTNWWNYTEAGGNTLSISVLATITDVDTTYFKVSFAEKNKDTTDNWFRRNAAGTQYSPSLVGTYFVLLPPVFTSRQGSFALKVNDNVSYSYADSLLVNGKYRKQVMQLTFSSTKIHGFDEIDFADGLGIIRMIDNSGRFPVVYTLDSARINGVIYR